MGLLNHLFGSTEAIAREIETDETSIARHWRHYLGTISEKKEVIQELRLGYDLQGNLLKLKQLLKVELVDISDEEKEESELISDLDKLEHAEKIKRVHKLEQCLGYAETKYEYVHGLLHHLHSILKSQLHLVEKLFAGSRQAERLLSHIRLQLELELETIKKIEQIETFHNLFSALVRGEHTIKVMDSREKQLIKRMQKGVSKVFSGEITEGTTHDWAMAVFTAIEGKVHEAVANSVLEYHPDVDFEFANRPEFIDFVREKIPQRKTNVSEQMITAFVHLFREWYNHGRG